MRLTLDLVQDKGVQTVDPNENRALVLRGFKLSAIENLGITKDMYGCIDLSDNEISRIENIPKLNRLKSLIVANNSVSWIAPDVFESLPELTSLVLTSNRIARMSSLLPLAPLRRLERLSLLHNPVTKEPHYKSFIIHLVGYSRTLRFIDFQRVTDKDREDAKTFFTSPEGLALLRKFIPEESAPEPIKTAEATGGKPALSEDILNRIKIALMEATDMEVVGKLERSLKSGDITSDVAKLIGIE